MPDALFAGPRLAAIYDDWADTLSGIRAVLRRGGHPVFVATRRGGES